LCSGDTAGIAEARESMLGRLSRGTDGAEGENEKPRVSPGFPHLIGG
jgi:hypothetical protein